MGKPGYGEEGRGNWGMECRCGDMRLCFGPLDRELDAEYVEYED